ncbi:MAG: Cu(I)-responsive transcriptional regulator [Neisseria sp.]|nr:Cu(I)-responsive transcriptional regulator [Neisseria sp.]
MNISQAAQASGLSAKMIRDYEKMGLIPSAKRSENGYRRYDENDVALLQFIRRAREVDFSLAETAELLRLWQDPQRTSAAVKAITANHIAMLDQKIARLSAMRDTLRGWHTDCCGDQRPECAILDGLLS